MLDAAGLPAASPLPLTAVGFTGRYHDAESGLIYYRARYYDPTLGRFISRDPIAEWGGINLYGYCGGDPVGATDPMGWETYEHIANKRIDNGVPMVQDQGQSS